MSEALEQAYDFCRNVARREAKNFYYAFRVLPKPKRDAMCAVYAFMRRADDLADDETLSLDARRTAMHAWLADWRATRSAPADPVFLALVDTQRRFAIPDALLEDLVRGTSMDLELDAHGPGLPVRLPDGMLGYETFDDLYRYCYLVASVVGLVCIRIFGYRDPAAELLAERTGVAFQLTNILRDVKEDVERSRVYLPQRMLARFEMTDADVLALAGGRPVRMNERALFAELSAQARAYYEAVHALMPLIDPDSRAALWVLATIYRRLLTEIDARHGDVFSRRVSVSTAGKLAVLARGAWMQLRARSLGDSR